MKKVFIFCLYICNLTHAMDNSSPKTQLAIICAPYADVMLKPESNKNNNHQDANQDTQVLYNEPVTILESQNGWYRIATPEQMKVEGNTKLPHEGWVEEKYVALQEPYSDSDTSFPIIVQSRSATIAFSHPDQETSKMLEIFAGTKLYALGDNTNSYKVKLVDDQTKEFSIGYINKTDVCKLQELRNLDTQNKRDLIVKHAQKFLDTPYFWGGMTYKGIDCSGLTHVCYRMAGLPIPLRDSKDQYAAAHKCAPKYLQNGDLIFFARAIEPTRIRHVAIYKGNDGIIDAAGTDAFNKVWEKVREITGQEWLGKSFTQMEQGEQVGPYVIYGGTYLQ